MGKNKQKTFVIGVDGGGSKTKAVLADLNGKVLETKKSGASNPHNVGAENAICGIFQVISGWLKTRDVSVVFIGLAGVQEEEKMRRLLERKILQKIRKFGKIFKGKIIVKSDQLAAFRSGTDKKDGVLLIAGTGCVARGWNSNKESKASGFGWLADEGSAFWVGQKSFQTLLKSLDKRGPKTALVKAVFKEFKLKRVQDLMRLVYQNNPTLIVPKFSIICDKMGKKGDKVAKNILIEAGEELAISAKTIIEKLKFSKKEFPLVLTGSMFKSDILLNTVKKEIRKFAPKAEFIRPKVDPVEGAVRLAIENVRDRQNDYFKIK